MGNTVYKNKKLKMNDNPIDRIKTTSSVLTEKWWKINLKKSKAVEEKKYTHEELMKNVDFVSKLETTGLTSNPKPTKAGAARRVSYNSRYQERYIDKYKKI